MLNYIRIILFCVILGACGQPGAESESQSWKLSILPSSVRLDPVRNEIIDDRFTGVKNEPFREGNLLDKNWVYDGESVLLHGARGEYVSFQVVLTNYTDSMLTNMKLEIAPFKSANAEFQIGPEIFLEWSVEVKTPSTGYPKASLGTGWYPDALIPFDRIQSDSSKVKGRWVYPLTLPDFNNRIEGQRSQIFWVDQYIPFDVEDAKPGEYTTTLSLTVGDVSEEVPVVLRVWNFAIPNENEFKASLQQEGFIAPMNEEQELEVYQLFKRNRVGLMDPTYAPELQMLKNGSVRLEWEEFDHRLKKYLTGEAFTPAYGYDYGPGLGEPIETFALPFDVYGKHGTRGWPDIGKPDVERNPENQALYVHTIQKVREHLKEMVNPKKTDLTVYLNGLDESYFLEAWKRMVFYGDVFRKHYPEAQFRVDGAYDEEAMAIIGNSINAWASHTINYNIEQVRKHQQNGIKDWLYGPMLYESKANSWVGSSTFIDLPLVNDRAVSWACWKYDTYSWLSWGIGAGWEQGWYDPESWKDFYKEASEADAEFTYRKFNGNGSLIYKPGTVPNVNVVCPSIRLKTMRTGIQDYEYMRLLEKLDGNSERVDGAVDDIINRPFGDEAIGRLDVWTYDAAKWDQSRITLGEMIHEKIVEKE